MKYTKLFLGFMSFFLIGNGVAVFAGGSGEQEQVVNVYSGRHYEIDTTLYKQFTEATGITVNVIQGKADALIQRIAAEGENTDMDLLWLVDVGRLYRTKTKGLLQKITDTSVLDRVSAPYKDKDGMWLAITKRARVIVYDKQKGMPNIDSYDDLAVPKGPKVLVRSSSSIYNISLIAQMIHVEGEDGASKWVKGLVSNFARPPQGNDRDQMRSLIAGIGDVAIVNTYYVGLLRNSEDKNDVAIGKRIGIIFPSKTDGSNNTIAGTHVNISGVGISKYAKHKKAAYALISFLLKKESQETITNANYEYPITKDAEPNKLLKSWGEFTEMPIEDLNVYGTLAPDATRIADINRWQ